MTAFEEWIAELQVRLAELTRERDEAQARIAELETWARKRIEECQRTEKKFWTETQFSDLAPPHIPYTLVEAEQERRTLEAVLAMLGRQP